MDGDSNPRDGGVGCYFWGLGHVCDYFAWDCGRIILSYAVGQLTTTMVRDMRNDLYAKLQEYSHHEYEQIGVSSLVTRLTSDAFVLYAVCGFYVEDGGHHTLDDGFQCSLDSDDQSFSSVDCSSICTISCCRRLVCSS